MKVVLDTNVFVSGIFWSGPPFEILKAWRDRRLSLIVTPEILQEYRRVSDELKTKHGVIDFSSFLDLLTVEAKICMADHLPIQVSRDPDDDKFIACALASGTKHIISGDKDLLSVSGFQGVEVLKPRDFVRRFLGKKLEK